MLPVSGWSLYKKGIQICSNRALDSQPAQSAQLLAKQAPSLFPWLPT